MFSSVTSFSIWIILKPNFNIIAPLYDQLSFLVFGNNLIKAKKQFLHFIPRKGHLLIMGGGTGNVLNYLLKHHEELKIDFIDSSSKMVSLSRTKIEAAFTNRVHFICGSHKDVPLVNYDAITMFFVLDCMKQQEGMEFATSLFSHLKDDGLFLFADFFHTPRISQRILIWLMYRFFQVVAGITAFNLPAYEQIFQQLQLIEIEKKIFLNGFIQSGVYKKSTFTR